jgi:hypothetical protein
MKLEFYLKNVPHVPKNLKPFPLSYDDGHFYLKTKHIPYVHFYQLDNSLAPFIKLLVTLDEMPLLQNSQFKTTQEGITFILKNKDRIHLRTTLDGLVFIDWQYNHTTSDELNTVIDSHQSIYLRNKIDQPMNAYLNYSVQTTVDNVKETLMHIYETINTSTFPHIRKDQKTL